MSTPKEGGTDWELRTALKTIAIARAAGDFVAEALGWIRFTQGLRNVTTGAMASQLVPMLQEVKAVKAKREDDALGFEASLDQLISLAQQQQTDAGGFAARIGVIEATIMPAAERQLIIALAHTIPSLTARIAALEARNVPD